MPANRTLGKTLAYRAFRAARAAFAEVITDEPDRAPENIALAMNSARLKLDEFGVVRGHPLREQLITAVVRTLRPGALVALAEGRAAHTEACNEQFGPRDDTPSLDKPWWEHR